MSTTIVFCNYFDLMWVKSIPVPLFPFNQINLFLFMFHGRVEQCLTASCGKICVCVQVSVPRVTIPTMASSPACLALWDPTNQRSVEPLAFFVGETWSPSTSLLCPSSSVRPKVRIFPASVLRVLTKRTTLPSSANIQILHPFLIVNTRG